MWLSCLLQKHLVNMVWKDTLWSYWMCRKINILNYSVKLSPFLLGHLWKIEKYQVKFSKPFGLLCQRAPVSEVARVKSSVYFGRMMTFYCSDETPLMNKGGGWFHIKSLVITQLKLLVLTLLTGENQDHSQRPNLPRTSTEGWHLAPALIVKCQNRTAHAGSGHLLCILISQWRSVSGTGLVFSPVIWVTEQDSSSMPLQIVSSFYFVKLRITSVLLCMWRCLDMCWSVCIKQEKQYLNNVLRI